MSRRNGNRTQGGRGGRGQGERRKARPPTNRHYPRTARLNRLLQQIVADHLGRADDDRLGFLTVTGVEVDAELSKAQVFLSTLDVDESTDAEVLEILAEEYRKPVQADIAGQARLRKTPEVVFVLDPAVRTGARIEEILASLELVGDEAEGEGEGDAAPIDEPDEEREVWVPNTDDPAYEGEDE